MKKLTTEDFVKKAKAIHGDKYDYSKVVYKKSDVEVCIVCPQHGEFWKTPENHLHRTKPQGCPVCAKEKDRYNQFDTEQFIEKARAIHGDRYDYSKVEYVNSGTKVCIICPTHGEFWQTPQGHLSGRGCRECGLEQSSLRQRKLCDDFIEEAQKIHGEKYDYSKVKYLNNRTKVTIICPKHGEFSQAPFNHLLGRGCPDCKREALSKAKTAERNDILTKMAAVHDNRYIYDETTYVNTATKMRIICPEHGEFWQTPHSHMSGRGCPQCNGGIKYTKADFIKKTQETHGDKYDYSKVEYVNSNVPVTIICPKHGDFQQIPCHHINGCGCPRCQDSRLEREMEQALQGEEFERGKHFEWLGKQHLDFFLPKYNIGIECQGKQHFGIGKWAEEGQFELIQELDMRKKRLCEENGCRLLYFSHEDFDEFLGEKIYKQAAQLAEDVKNGKIIWSPQENSIPLQPKS